MRNCRPILLVEDDQTDVVTTKRALKELNITNDLVHKVDGEGALEYLRDESNIRPCVIFLDLNLPKMNGFEFMEIVKSDNSLKKIPVIIVTASDTDESVTKSFDLAAAGYVLKAVDYGEFAESMRTVDKYWTLSSLPSHCD
ncbi:MAG: response regulator [Planctomycetota bacterium]|nr:response regulator [Planctomycetota bacterium]